MIEKYDNFKKYCYVNTKVVFDDNGYITNAKNFLSIMWGTENLDEKLIGKHITELAELLKKYSVSKKCYIDFITNVILPFYDYYAYVNNDNNVKIKIKKSKLSSEIIFKIKK